MVTWITQVQRTLSLSSETVWIAMSFFDRYLSSGKGNSQEVLGSKREFQLAAITSFYTAVKIYEPVVLGLDMLVQICRGTYTESDIISMENDILTALNWRVSCHTPMDFARHLLELLPAELSSSDSEILLEGCQRNVDDAVTDIHFSCSTPSTLGISCLASALTTSRILSLVKKQKIWVRLSELCDFDLSSNQVVTSLQRLLSHALPCKPNSSSKLDKFSQSNAAVLASSMIGSSLSSLVCVTQTAR